LSDGTCQSEDSRHGRPAIASGAEGLERNARSGYRRRRQAAQRAGARSSTAQEAAWLRRRSRPPLPRSAQVQSATAWLRLRSPPSRVAASTAVVTLAANAAPSATGPVRHGAVTRTTVRSGSRSEAVIAAAEMSGDGERRAHFAPLPRTRAFFIPKFGRMTKVYTELQLIPLTGAFFSYTVTIK
jgi:hypothetical protein